MKKRLISIFVVLFLVAALFTGCSNNTTTEEQAAGSEPAASDSAPAEETASSGGDGGYTIGFSNGYFGNTWRSQFLDDFEQVAKEYQATGKITDYTISNAETDAEQIAAINNFIAQGVDAILVVPRVESALAPVVEKAISQGIKVICLDDSSWDGAINVVLDNASTMRVQTEWMVEQLGGKGNIVYINGVPGENWNTVRDDVVKEVLAQYPDINVLAEAPGNWSDTDANQAMTTLLNTYKDIDGVLAQDVMGRGLVQAFETAQRDIPPICGDSANGYLNLWKEKPDLNAFTYTFPPGIGATGLRVAVNLLDGKELKPESLSPNATNPDMINSVVIPIPYFIVRDVPTNNPHWMEVMDPRSKVISLDEALKVNEGKPDNVTMDYIATQDEVDAFFQ